MNQHTNPAHDLGLLTEKDSAWLKALIYARETGMAMAQTGELVFQQPPSHRIANDRLQAAKKCLNRPLAPVLPAQAAIE